MLWVGDYQAAVRLAVDLNPLTRSYRGNIGGDSRHRLPGQTPTHIPVQQALRELL
jgi:hypothetical protein